MHGIAKCVGISVAAFGLGLLVSFFLPKSVLVVLEAIVIIVAGTFFVVC